MANYTGSCHCGAVRFEVTAEIDSLMECNCSICSRTGWKLAFLPAEQFTLLTGADALTSYKFGKEQLNHPFCKTCGIHPFSHGENPENGAETYAVNARCLEGAELDDVSVNHYDGAAL